MHDIYSFMLYISLRQYEYVVAIADAGSLTDAASRLNVAQPSLSVAITRVEDRLGASIFLRRRGASIEITPFGHRVISRARELLQLAEALEHRSSTAPTLTVGCFEDIAPWYLAPALNRLEAELPEMTFQGREGRFVDLASDLSEGRADVVISYDIGFYGNFERRTITSVTPVAFLAVNHPLAGHQSLQLEELSHYPAYPVRGKVVRAIRSRTL